MATKLIELDDNMLVEVEANPGEAEAISGGAAQRVNASLDSIGPFLTRACRPIVAAWRDVAQELRRDMHIEQAEVELGLSFGGEGSIFLAKSSASANITVKLVLTAKAEQP